MSVLNSTPSTRPTNPDRPSLTGDSPGAILSETVAAISAELGAELQGLTVDRVTVGLFFTGVKLSNGVGGIAATLREAVPHAVCCPGSAKALPTAGRIRGRPVSEFMANLGPANSLKRIVAIAVVSALSTTVMLRSGAADDLLIHDADGLDHARIGDTDYVVVVGAFVPMIRTLKARGRPFCILERDPSTLKPDELPFYAPAEAAIVEVPKADVLITTGTTLINDTLEDLVALTRPGTEIAVVGPTASLLPDAFFRRGVRVLGGVRVTDADELLDVLAEGGSGYHIFGRSADRVVMTAPWAQPVVASR